MYQTIHNQLFTSPEAAQAANDAALVSAVLLVAAELDQDPPADKAGVRDKLTAILGDTYAGRAVRHVLR